MSRAWAGLLALVLGAAVEAAPRLVLDTVQGDPGALRNQLATELCKQLPCVKLREVQAHGALDWAAVHQKDARVLSGRVTGGTKSPSASFTLEDKRDHVLGRWSFPLAKGRLSSEAVSSLESELRGQLGVTPAQPPPSAALTPSPVPTVPPAMPTIPPGELPKAPPGSPQPQTVSSASVPAAEELPLLSARTGFSALNIDLQYEGLSTGNLRSYHANFAPAVRFEVDSFPLAHVMKGWERGFGLNLAYETSVGYESTEQNGPSHPTHYHAFDAAASLRWHPFPSSGFVLQPIAGVRLASFSVDQVAGAVLTGLPDLSYNGLRLGAAAEYPVWRLRLIGRATFLPALSAGQIVSSTYFPKGKLYGWELEGGAVYPFLPHWDARLMIGYTRYHYSFDTVPGDPYQATGAANRYVGARLMIGYSFD
jgi:hypothetical protein